MLRYVLAAHDTHEKSKNRRQQIFRESNSKATVTENSMRVVEVTNRVSLGGSGVSVQGLYE